MQSIDTEPVKVLLVIRLMTGFESSIANGKWKPEGSPTISWLISGLEQDERFLPEVIFTRSKMRNRPDSWLKRFHKQKITFQGSSIKPLVLCHCIALLNGERLLGLKYFIRELFHAVAVFKFIKVFNPDLIYVDRSNWLTAAFVARLTKTKSRVSAFGNPTRYE